MYVVAILYIYVCICTITWSCFICTYLLLFTGPPALTVIIKNIENSSIVVQWDAVDDFLPTTYIVTWTGEGDVIQVATVEEQTSYTITGLTLDTVYTISVTAANWCGSGPEFRTRISLPTGMCVHVSSFTCVIFTN